MASRDAHASLTAAYQLMASYLLWDIRDLLSSGSLSNLNARGRLRQFLDLLDSANRAEYSVYSVDPKPRSGFARAELAKRVVPSHRDEELLELVIAARGDSNHDDVGSWVVKTRSVLEDVVARGWSKPEDEAEQRFLEDDVEPFLRRLQRIDQLENFRPASRPRLNRR
jgi:hypothetical protein